MNYDRFLTRVFDKQEKKMLYPGDTFMYGEDRITFKGICDNRVSGFKYYNKTKSDLTIRQYVCIYFGDRFMPMMCTGSCDKNNKLFYGEDIIKYQDGSIGKIHFNDELGYFTVKFRGTMFTCPSKSFLADCELLGNIHENEKLLEVKA